MILYEMQVSAINGAIVLLVVGSARAGEQSLDCYNRVTRPLCLSSFSCGNGSQFQPPLGVSVFNALSPWQSLLVSLSEPLGGVLCARPRGWQDSFCFFVGVCLCFG